MHAAEPLYNRALSFYTAKLKGATDARTQPLYGYGHKDDFS